MVIGEFRKENDARFQLFRKRVFCVHDIDNQCGPKTLIIVQCLNKSREVRLLLHCTVTQFVGDTRDRELPEKS